MFPYAAPRNTQQPFCAPRAQHQTCLPPAQAHLHPLRAAFRSLLASVHPLARSCSTAASKTGRRFAPFSSRRPHHITADAHPSFRTPHLILLHTQTSRSSSLPFKPVRLLRAPLAAPPGTCRLRSALPSVAPSSNRQPFLSVAFHHLSGANLAAPSDTNLLLLVPVSTDYFAPHHYPAAYTDQPNELAPLQARPSALRSPCSTLWQPSSPLRAPLAALSGNRQPFSAVRTLRHEPLPPSFSLRPSRPSPNQWPRQLPSAGHRPRPTFPLMRVARPAPPRFSTSAPDPSSSVSRSLSAQLFAVLLTSAHPPPSRIRSAATNEAIHRTTPQ